MKKIGFRLLILLIYFVIAELTLRIFWEPFDKKAYPYFANPYLRLSYPPNSEIITDHIVDQQKVLLKNNAFGFRASSMKSISKEPNVYRIFFIGGSAVEQSWLPEEETFPKIIEDYLNARSENIRFECINAGKEAAVSADSVALLAHEIIHYEPDMVFIMDALNDLSMVSFYKGSPACKYRDEYLVTYTPRLSKIVRDLLKKSYLLIFLKTKVYDNIVNSVNLGRRPSYWSLEQGRIMWRKAAKKRYTTFPTIEEFKKNLKSLIGIAKTNGIRICFLTQPSLYSEDMAEDKKNVIWGFCSEDETVPDIFSLDRGMKLFNGQVKTICRENNVEHIDLANMMPRELRYFIDHCHYTPEGARFIAEIITDYLWHNRLKFAKD